MKSSASLLVAFVVISVSAVAMAESRTGMIVLKPEQLKAMTLDQMLTDGETAVKEMDELVKNVLDGLAEAQGAKDFQRMNCISDVLTTIKGLMRLSEQNALSLRERVIAKDRAGAEHEFVKLSIARSKVAELHAQAKGCGGPAGETVFEGSPLVDRIFDQDLPVEEARSGLQMPAIVIEPPPSASPYY